MDWSYDIHIYITCIYCSFHSTLFILYIIAIILCIHPWGLFFKLGNGVKHRSERSRNPCIQQSGPKGVHLIHRPAGLHLWDSRNAKFLTLRLRDSNIHGGNQAGIYLDTGTRRKIADVFTSWCWGNSWQIRLELIVFWKGHSQVFFQ